MNDPRDIAPDPVWFLRDEDFIKRLIMKFEGSLSEDDVAQMLGISRRTLSRWIEDGTWIMPVGPDGKRRCSLAQYREQFHLTHKYNGR